MKDALVNEILTKARTNRNRLSKVKHTLTLSDALSLVVFDGKEVYRR